MVLRPGRAGECCSLTLEYTQPLDAALPPSLVIELANPRVLLLFRCCCFPLVTWLCRHAHAACDVPLGGHLFLSSMADVTLLNLRRPQLYLYLC